MPLAKKFTREREGSFQTDKKVYKGTVSEKGKGI
jgi:hypothetical protein